MKTAISLPDDLFDAADSLAGRLGVSRSRLFAMALAEFIAKHRSSKVTERLDAVYSVDTGDIDEGLGRAQKRSIRRTEW